MDKVLLKKLLRHTHLVRFQWHTHPGQWGVTDLCNSNDRDDEYDWIAENKSGIFGYRYNLDLGVYLYRLVKNEYVLIAKVTNKGIRVYEKRKAK